MKPKVMPLKIESAWERGGGKQILRTYDTTRARKNNKRTCEAHDGDGQEGAEELHGRIPIDFTKRFEGAHANPHERAARRGVRDDLDEGADEEEREEKGGASDEGREARARTALDAREGFNVARDRVRPDNTAEHEPEAVDEHRAIDQRVILCALDVCVRACDARCDGAE